MEWMASVATVVATRQAAQVCAAAAAAATDAAAATTPPEAGAEANPEAGDGRWAFERVRVASVDAVTFRGASRVGDQVRLDAATTTTKAMTATTSTRGLPQ